MKIYLLYYDTDNGAREEWNTFYTPVEVFDSPEKRQQRIDFLSKLLDPDSDGGDKPYGFFFHPVDKEIMTDDKINEYEV